MVFYNIYYLRNIKYIYNVSISILNTYLDILLYNITLTVLEAVSGKRKANSGPFNKFKWILNRVVTVLLGGADNKYIWNTNIPILEYV